MVRDNNLKKGKNNIEMILLRILQDGSYYGYQLSQLVSEYSGKRISIPEGSLYPALYRLLDKGYISDEKRQTGKRMTRIYYHLEPSGLAYYETLLQEYTNLNEGIQLILNHSTEREE